MRHVPTLALMGAFGLGLWAVEGPAQTGPADPPVAPDMVALTPASDAVVARRLVMNAIGANNDALHDMMDGVIAFDAYELESRLAAMSAMFLAFPNLYRAAPDPWSAEAEAADPLHVSLAAPAVWEQWDAFDAMSTAAWQITLDASLAPHDQVKALIDELEGMCEDCHDQFRTALEFHDFDMLPPAEN